MADDRIPRETLDAIYREIVTLRAAVDEANEAAYANEAAEAAEANEAAASPGVRHEVMSEITPVAMRGRWRFRQYAWPDALERRERWIARGLMVPVERDWASRMTWCVRRDQRGAAMVIGLWLRVVMLTRLWRYRARKR